MTTSFSASEFFTWVPLRMRSVSSSILSFRLVFAGQDACDFFQHFFAGDLGQETEVALIHAYEGDAIGSDFAGGGKEGAVAAQNDDQAAFAADVVFVG